MNLKYLQKKYLGLLQQPEKLKNSLNSFHVGCIYKKLAQLAKAVQSTVKNISGYSLRVRVAQDLMLSGTTLTAILNRGRWSMIDTVMSYVELAK